VIDLTGLIVAAPLLLAQQASAMPGASQM